jgi:DNA-binding NtrC family response regulator
MSAPVERSYGTERPLKDLVGLSLEEVERRFILATLDACDWHRGKAAEALGVTARTLSNKLRVWRQRQEAKALRPPYYATASSTGK